MSSASRRIAAHQSGSLRAGLKSFTETEQAMKVLVPVKRVVDANVRVRVKADGSAVDIAPRLATLKRAEPPKREAGMCVDDAADLVAKLKNVAHVI